MNCSIALIDILHIAIRLRLEDHASFVQAFNSETRRKLSVFLFLKAHPAPVQNIEDLTGGDEGARCEAGGQIGRRVPESREAMRTSFRLGGRWDAPCRICGPLHLCPPLILGSIFSRLRET